MSTTAKSKTPDYTFTLTQIEDARPCHTAYRDFLNKIRSNPSEAWQRLSEGHGITFTTFKRPKYSRDQKISLTDVDLNDEERDWLLLFIPTLQVLAEHVSMLGDDYEARIALVFAGHYPLKPKAKGRQKK